MINRVQLGLAAAYVQKQIELSLYVQLIAGARFDYFDLKLRNNNTNISPGAPRAAKLTLVARF
ncbi:MAG: hypothetical protein ABJB34_01895 [Acidobacteriota bacterium]